ncbi:N utilization substance protein B [Luteitalea sp. TBR-22]|uniref:transcription antitermination factor NusB n=1 Tax=Luteitalea sp. TBR-22 TaxID=2802971 RepID=UPI001AF1D68A|nr:transcription antitermination factor NusB [Luteitalea sp. TBR-22]BCS34145.1 N utilization substance protein B [Luteitalea sp. TBR-22]
MSLDAQQLRQARESALQMLYGWEMTGDALPEAIAGVRELQLRPPVAERDALAVALAQGTARTLDRIDPLIAEAATNWRIERLAVIDRLVLRLAVFELLERREVPPAVVINEALELARTFSAPDAVRFVNGVLDAIRKRLEKERSPGSGQPPSPKAPAGPGRES